MQDGRAKNRISFCVCVCDLSPCHVPTNNVRTTLQRNVIAGFHSIYQKKYKKSNENIKYIVFAYNIQFTVNWKRSLALRQANVNERHVIACTLYAGRIYVQS